MKCNYCKKEIKEKLDGSCYCSEMCKDKFREYNRIYSHSDKGKEYIKKAQQLDKYKEYQKKYQQSDKYKKVLKKYNQSAKGKERFKKYRKTNVPPSIAINDYLKRVERIKFHSTDELKQDINNYAKAVCSIQGNCKEIAKKISETDQIKDYIERQDKIPEPTKVRPLSKEELEATRTWLLDHLSKVRK